MAFQPAPGVWGVEINMLLDQQIVQNTLYIDRGEQVATEEGAVLIGDSVLAWWAAEYAPSISDQVALRDVVVTDLAVQNGIQATRPAPANEVGSLVSPFLPANVTFCVKFLSGLAGRSARGRNYVVGLVEGDVTGNELSVGRADAIRQAYADFPTYITAPNTQWVILSRYANKAQRPTAVTFSVVTVAYTDRVIDSQRRRLPARGR